MRAFALIPLLFVPASWAVPASDLQAVLAEVGDLSGGIFGGIAKGIEHVAEGVFTKGKERVEQWVHDGREFVKQDGLVCEYASRRREARLTCATARRLQTNSLPVRRSRTISCVLRTPSYVILV